MLCACSQKPTHLELHLSGHCQVDLTGELTLKEFHSTLIIVAWEFVWITQGVVLDRD